MVTDRDKIDIKYMYIKGQTAKEIYNKFLLLNRGNTYPLYEFENFTEQLKLSKEEHELRQYILTLTLKLSLVFRLVNLTNEIEQNTTESNRLHQSLAELHKEIQNSEVD